MHVAAVPAALFALIVALASSKAATLWHVPGKVADAAALAIGGLGALVIYVILSRTLHVAEVTDLTAMVRSRLRR
jgi:hypothetical protein